MSKSVALFGGSFNPPHRGHYEIAKRVARRRSIDEVWILPVYRHPFGKKMESFARRLQWCRGFFRPLGPKVKVKDLERRLGGTSYTIRLIQYLRRRYSGIRFHLVIGRDAYDERSAWKGFEEIRESVDLIMFPRGKGSPIPDLSSTAIRARKRSGRR